MRARTIYRSSLWVMAFLATANMALAVYVFVKMRNPVNYNVNVVEPPRLDLPVMTNEIAVARSGLLPQVVDTVPLQVDTSNKSVPVAWQHEYHYCVVAGRRVAYLNGVYVREGDRHAYGVVRDIYPERIYFEGGNYIDNTSTRRAVLNESVSTGNLTISP